jgi:ribosomal protein S6--L-glutamate ligase
MNLVILSRDRTLYSTRRLARAAERRGHDVRVIDYLRCYMDITSERPRILHQDEELQGIDAVIPRIGASHTFYGTAVLRQFEMMGVFCCNDSQAIARSRDKLRSIQVLTRAGLRLPRTGFANSTKDIDGLIDVVGGPPLVIKLLEGTQGIGVILAETRQAAEAVIAAFRGLDADILLQQYIAEAKGRDHRCFVVGGRVVAAMERRALEGEFRSNLHRGATAHAVKLSKEARQVAVRAARATGLNVAGVDLLPSAEGPLVLEVNSSPGLEGIERATGIDVAEEVLDFVERNIRN